MTMIKSDFLENHEGDVIFLYNGKDNVIGLSYPDAVIANNRLAHFIRIATVTFDQTLQFAEENIVDETFSLRVENSVNAQYAANSCTVKLIGHVAGKRITKDKFKCIVTPDVGYLDIPELYLIEDTYTTSDNKNEYRLEVWLHTVNVRRIFMTKVSSHARNAAPINAEYLDSRYYFDLMTNEKMIYNTDTSNLSAVIKSKRFTEGINIFSQIDSRLNTLEAVNYPDFKHGYIIYDPSWTPSTSGSESIGYQQVPAASIDYSSALSTPFMSIDLTPVNKAVRVNEPGLYLFQIVSGLNTTSAMEDNDIELSLFKNTDIIQSSTIIYKLRADNGELYTNPMGLSGGMVLLDLQPSDSIRLQFKFLSDPHNGIINRSTRVQVVKILQRES